MEGSKAFSKAFMDRNSIPTAKFKVFRASEVEQAIEYGAIVSDVVFALLSHEVVHILGGDAL